ncbi:helix-turn-helix domain-containing protein [Streptomyces sp. NPDC046985]|uniref:TetR/AcrR family transcriptional regulator n=1 Tax=Streptomyces sp. NPDC046985 TaxID=3155377 RepID=UPI0033C7B6B7
MSALQDEPARTPRPRADVVRNRARLLEVARAALAGDGETTMQSIAKATGVGQGTIYRHFPTREALLLEVYRADFGALVDSAYALLERHSPDVALRSWFDDLAVFGRKKHALADVLDAATRAELHDEQYDRIIEAIRAILDAGVACDALRSDLDAEEVLPLVAFLWQLDTRTDPRIPHLLDVVLDGIRTR